MEKYELPKGWRWVRLGEVCLKAQQRDPRRIPHTDFIYVDISSVDNATGKITTSKVIKGEDAPSRARKVIRAYDVIFATTRPYLKGIALVPPELNNQICSTGFCVLRADPVKVLSDWLFHVCRSELVLSQVIPLMRGANYPAVTDKDVFTSEIPLPPLSEQRRIVARIEELVSRIEEAKRLRRAAREEAEAIMPAALHEVFSQTGSKDWRRVRLGEVMDLTNGKGITRKEMTDNGTYPVFGSNGIVGRTNNYLIQKRTIVIGRVGACGALNVTNGPAWISDNAMYVSKISDDLDLMFLYYGLQELNLSKLAKIAAQPSISQEPIKEQSIPFPPLPEQLRIVGYLDRLQAKVEELRRLQEETQKELDAMTSAILDKAFQGGL